MRARTVSLLLLLLAVVLVVAAGWAALHGEVSGDTRCGPIVIQKNVKEAACDGFYDRQYVLTGALFGSGLAAWAAAAIVERQVDRKADEQRGRRTDRYAAR